MGAYKSGLVVQLGPIKATADLNSVVPSKKATGTRRLCPEHHLPLKQGYNCEAEGEAHPVEWGSWVQGKAVGDSWAIIEEAPKFPPDTKIEFAAIKAEEVDAATFMEGSIYYIEPSPNHHEEWELLRRLASDSKLAIIGKGTFRAGPTRKMWRLTTFRGYLVMRELKFPEGLAETPKMPVVKLTKAHMDFIKQWLADNTETWDKFDSADDGLAAFEKILESAATVPYKDHVKPSGESDSNVASIVPLLDALKAGVEGAGKKKRAG